MRRANFLTTIRITTLLAFSVMLLTYASAQPLRTPPSQEETKYSVEIGDSPTLGPSDAPVVIVEFSDFQ